LPTGCRPIKIFAAFRDWLVAGGYSQSAVKQYCGGVRLALSLLDKPHSQIDLTLDLDRVRDYLTRRDLKPSTLATYHKGLSKLAHYLRYRRSQPEPERPVAWEKYLAPFTLELAADIRAYIAYRGRSWQPEQQRQSTLNLLSHLTSTLRGLGYPTELTEITPLLWLDYVERRLQAGIQPATLNRELYDLQSFLQFLADSGRPIEARMLAVEPQDADDPLPRDVSVSQLRQLLVEVESAAENQDNRQALLDRAWLLLMLHSGLRTAEIRHLRLADLDVEKRQLRIEQGKGQQERLVFLSEESLAVLQVYLAVRGPALTDHVFIFRHRPLRVGYCGQRLRAIGRRCGLHVTPHRPRHSCATLLLNAGAPILTVQRVLGHRYVQTTLRYARLYEATVIKDYRKAMETVEGG
jgi:site-specific recombinase XerD